MWLFCFLDPFIPTEIKFLATPLVGLSLLLPYPPLSFRLGSFKNLSLMQHFINFIPPFPRSPQGRRSDGIAPGKFFCKIIRVTIVVEEKNATRRRVSRIILASVVNAEACWSLCTTVCCIGAEMHPPLRE